MTSVRIEEIDEKDRSDLIEVKSIPNNPKIKQVAFTRQRMFVTTEKGDLYVFKIEEHFPRMEDIDHFNSGASLVTADIQIDSPILVKDISNLKMIGCGSDHFIGLTNDGKVYAMGDDTFG